MSGHRVVPQSVAHFYSATKYAVTALTEGLRQELREAQTHIRATVRMWPGPGGDGIGTGPLHPNTCCPGSPCPGCAALEPLRAYWAQSSWALLLLAWPCSVLESRFTDFEVGGGWPDWNMAGETEGKQGIVGNQVHSGRKLGLWALPLKAE